MHEEIIEGLKKIPFFEDIPEEALIRLAEHGVRKSYPKQVIVINEGDEPGPLFVLLAGKVRVYLSNEDGKVVTLSTQEAGSYFGELSLLDDSPRSASVMTIEPTTCALIGKSVFKEWLRENPDVGLCIIRGLTRRIRALTENVRSLALSDVYGRLVTALQNLAVEENGQLIIRERLSHQELANMVGSCREMVSRIMKDLTIGGYVLVEGKALRILRKPPPSY